MKPDVPSSEHNGDTGSATKTDRSVVALGRGWEWVKDYWSILRPMRFSVAVWLAITFLIVVIPQAQDALLALVEDAAGGVAGVGNAAVFSGLALFWAFQTFYWARFVSRLPSRRRESPRYPPPILNEAEVERLNRLVPRRLGALVLVSVWAALLRANWPGDIASFEMWLVEAAICVVMVALAVIYFSLVRRRRDLAELIHRRTGLAAFKVAGAFTRDLAMPTLPPPLIRVGLWLVLGTLAVFVASGFVDLRYPRPIAFLLGVIWIAFGCRAAGRVTGLPRSTVATLRFNIAIFGVLYLLSIAPSAPLIGQLSFLTSAPIIMSVRRLGSSAAPSSSPIPASCCVCR